MTDFLWVPRNVWGSNQTTEQFIRDRRSDPGSVKTEIQVHHTAATDNDDSTPNRWDYGEAVTYMRRLQWSRPDLGPLPYSENIAVSENLSTVWIFEGRGILKRGAHTGGHNVAGVGWGVLGNFDKPDTPAAQLAVRAIELQARTYRATITPNLGSVLNPKGWVAWGHRDSSTKTCPGHSLYPLLTAFSLEDDGMASPGQKLVVDLAFNLFPEEVKGDPNFWKNLPDEDPQWQTTFAPALSKGAQNLYKRVKESGGVSETRVNELISEHPTVVRKGEGVVIKGGG